ncbi:hypothetical protein CcCBS67573_g07171 [Chytriomyces confervae]|uniref:Dynein assembly factor 1, axonemal homolog n=1 Tax=Chytriomyces confervae TaxID=246404 RepID=A0A507EWN1_9FUNG|nr:hypothetical protein CcCBS67573_g07171 [Chytriomyces confervae]
MTPKYLKQLCLEQNAYSTASLNDKIYLHFKGFADIENLEGYTGLRSLWLEGNGLSAIKNLDTLIELRCLFLHQNCIETIENLDALVNLDTLNVGNNLIKRIQGLSNLHKLRTLQIDHNYLKTAEDLAHLRECPFLSILDLSFNHIEDVGVVEVFEQMPELSVLNLMSNPVISKIQNYRRSMVSRIKKLTYLDDRPVFDKERLATEAWAIGGLEAEREERQRQKDEERREHDRNFEALKQLQEEARARRLQTYGPDKEPEFEPKLAKFRDEMLSKIEDAPQAQLEGDIMLNMEPRQISRIEAVTMAENGLLEDMPAQPTPRIEEIEDDDEVPLLEEVKECTAAGIEAKKSRIEEITEAETDLLEDSADISVDIDENETNDLASNCSVPAIVISDFDAETRPSAGLFKTAETSEAEEEIEDVVPGVRTLIQEQHRRVAIVEVVDEEPVATGVRAAVVSADSDATLLDAAEIEEQLLEEVQEDKPAHRKLSVRAWESL